MVKCEREQRPIFQFDHPTKVQISCRNKPTVTWKCGGQGVREKARVFETLNFFGKGLTQIETDVQLL